MWVFKFEFCTACYALRGSGFAIKKKLMKIYHELFEFGFEALKVSGSQLVIASFSNGKF